MNWSFTKKHETIKRTLRKSLAHSGPQCQVPFSTDHNRKHKNKTFPYFIQPRDKSSQFSTGSQINTKQGHLVSSLKQQKKDPQFEISIINSILSSFKNLSFHQQFLIIIAAKKILKNKKDQLKMARTRSCRADLLNETGCEPGKSKSPLTLIYILRQARVYENHQVKSQ